MAVKWHQSKEPGVRFREHPKRKHGVGRDRYFSIYYRVNGKRREEGLGWASEGWTLEEAKTKLVELKKANRLGEGPRTLAEKQKLADEKATTEAAAAEKAEAESMTFVEFFEKSYLPGAKITTKPESYEKQAQHVKAYIGPVLGRIALKDVRLFHLEKIRAAMVKAGRSPRTMQYVFSTVRRVWNVARKKGLVTAESPTKDLSLPKINNERQRFLTADEADTLLEALAKKDHQTFCLSLLAYHCGLRFSEITGLTWACIDFDNNRVKILNAKGHQDRAVPMTGRVADTLKGLESEKGSALVLKNTKGQRLTRILNIFQQTVAELGFNAGITDPKMKFCFHSLRHSYASGLVAAGVDLYRVQKLLGHRTPSMTTRYSHVADEGLDAAVKAFEAKQAPAEDQGGRVVNLDRSK